jgi:hypothetical protein
MNDSRRRRFPSWLPLAAGLAVAVLGMILLWALVIKADEDAERDDGPAIVETSDLSDAADRAGHPIYWAGERPDSSLELAEAPDGGPVYVRYLDAGAEAGVRSADFMTVATYAVDDAAAALRRGSKKRPNAELARGKGGALVLIDPATPGSVRIAYPGADEQIELYTPNVEESIRLATDGSIQPVP